MQRFEGRVALVTGAAQGIGKAVAERVTSEGGAVAVTDLRLEAAAETAAGLKDAIGLECDVTARESVDAAVAATVERYGRLDLLVNNAGGCIVDPDYLESSSEDWHRQLDLTLLGANRCIQAAMPHLLKTRGNVVSIGSVNGLAAFRNIEYSAAKAGLQNLTRNLAVEFGPRGVRFNVVAPGTVNTPNWDTQPGALERLAAMYPLRRVAEASEIAAAVAFLGSDDAAFVTGITLPVEGGVLTGPAAGWMGPQTD